MIIEERTAKYYDRNLARDVLKQYGHLSDKEIIDMLDDMVILEVSGGLSRVDQKDLDAVNEIIKHFLDQQDVKHNLHGTYSFVISIQDYNYLKLTESSIFTWCYVAHIKEQRIAQLLINEINKFLR